MIREDRKYVRFIAQDDAFAALGAGFKKVGKINDISINGLSFSYLSHPTEDKEYEDDLFVDIFLSGNAYHLPRVPCDMVYEITDFAFNFNGAVFLRCGLKFKELKRHQLDQLNVFLKYHKKGSLSSQAVPIL